MSLTVDNGFTGDRRIEVISLGVANKIIDSIVLGMVDALVLRIVNVK